jgi:hypothetical protein
MELNLKERDLWDESEQDDSVMHWKTSRREGELARNR